MGPLQRHISVTWSFIDLETYIIHRNLYMLDVDVLLKVPMYSRIYMVTMFLAIYRSKDQTNNMLLNLIDSISAETTVSNSLRSMEIEGSTPLLHINFRWKR